MLILETGELGQSWVLAGKVVKKTRLRARLRYRWLPGVRNPWVIVRPQTLSLRLRSSWLYKRREKTPTLLTGIHTLGSRLVAKDL